MHTSLSRLALALTLTSVTTLAAQRLLAQAPQAVFSPGFEEPKGIGFVLQQTRIGTTLLINFTRKDGIDVTVFSKEGRKSAHRVIRPQELKEDRMARGSVIGTFDVGSKTALFIEQINLNTPELYRLIINSETGALESEQKIAEMQKFTILNAYAAYYGMADGPKSFSVDHDPATDCYAVVSYDERSGKDSKRLRVQHFDSTNKIINDAICDPPAEEYKLTRYIAMKVDGKDGVLMALYCSEGRQKTDPSKVFVSRLTTGSKEFEHYPMPGYEDPQTTTGVMRYNPTTQRMMLLTVTRERSKGRTTYYSLMLSAIDPKDPSKVGVKQLTAESIPAYKRTKKSREEKPFTGLPQDMLVMDDGSVTIPFEEITNVTTTNGRVTYSTSNLGDVGIVRVLPNGSESPGHVIRRKEATPGYTDFLTHPRWDAGGTAFNAVVSPFGSLGASSDAWAFFQFDYFTVGNTGYLLVNSNPDNAEKSIDEEPRSASSFAQTEGVLYKIEGDKVTRTKLFNGSVDDRTNKVMHVRTSDFNPRTNRYAVLVADRSQEKESKWKVAWLQF